MCRISAILLMSSTIICGCYSASHFEAKGDNEMDVLSSAINGDGSLIELCNVSLHELPAAFSITTLKSDDGKEAPVLPQKDISIRVSAMRLDEKEVIVTITPAINEVGASCVHLECIVRYHASWRDPVAYQQYSICSGNRADCQILSLGEDLKIYERPSPDWIFAVAIAGNRGILCWSGNSMDDVLEPYESGFRRFHISGRRLSEGQKLLREIRGE